jgi:DNA-directed RNA polymerase subunit RPC12/RpoP
MRYEMSKENYTGLFYEDPKHNTWIAIEPRENGKYKVILPARKSPMTVSDIEDLFNWLNKLFPDSVDIVKVTEVPYTEVTEPKPAELRCPKCGCREFTKNGFNLKGEQRYICKHCFKTFIPEQSNSQEYSPLNT